MLVEEVFELLFLSDGPTAADVDAISVALLPPAFVEEFKPTFLCKNPV